LPDALSISYEQQLVTSSVKLCSWKT